VTVSEKKESLMIERIASLIDPQAGEAKKSDQITLGSQFDFIERRRQSLAAAERVLDVFEPQCSAGLVMQDLQRRIQEVREIHKKDTSGQVAPSPPGMCEVCMYEWPCPTMRALGEQ
jgi:hypothetical protein